MKYTVTTIALILFNLLLFIIGYLILVFVPQRPLERSVLNFSTALFFAGTLMTLVNSVNAMVIAWRNRMLFWLVVIPVLGGIFIFCLRAVEAVAYGGF